MEERVTNDDWRKALLVLWEGDEVDRLKKLVPASHIDTHGEQGTTLLHVACYHGRMSSAGWLLERGAEKEARDDWGQTPIHFAAANGHAGCVALLLRHGAYIDALDKNGCPPLADAVLRGQHQACCILLDAGASVELAQKKTRIPPWVGDFLRGRNACITSATILFARLRPRLGRDMARLIATLVCTTRGANEWGAQP